LERRAMRLP